MNRHLIYLVTDVVMRGDPPKAGYHATTGPDDADTWIVASEDWDSVAEQDRWEALSGVTCLNHEDHGKPATVGMTTAFASWGVAPGQTRREALIAVRKIWPGLKV